MTWRILKRFIILVSIYTVLIIFTSFSIIEEYNTVPPYLEFEKIIREKYDPCAVFRWSQYAELLEKLKDKKFIVLPLDEMRNTFIPGKVIVGIRHDVDMNPFKAMEMAELESFYGVRSTYFFLATAEYSGHFEKKEFIRSPVLKTILLKINSLGSEIGIHNDLLTIMIEHNIDPLTFNRNEISYYRSLGINIHGTAAHGSMIAKKTVPNFEIFSDYNEKKTIDYGGNKYHIGILSLKQYGFAYEAYKILFNKYFSDSGGKWNGTNNFNGMLEQLDESKAGDRIELLVHPDWWGVNK
jgi:hypothetical protein